MQPSTVFENSFRIYCEMKYSIVDPVDIVAVYSCRFFVSLYRVAQTNQHLTVSAVH